MTDALTQPPVLGEEIMRVSRIDLAVDFQGWLVGKNSNPHCG